MNRKLNYTPILLLMLMLCLALAAGAERPVRILAIGNSFSEDAIEQNFREVCASEGVSVIVGNLFQAACDIDTHLDNLVNDKAAYRYRKILADGRMIEIKKATMTRALRDEKWDYISFQQGSKSSGIYSSYANLGKLMALVREIAGKQPVFMWHMTWAYASNSKHEGFKAYDMSQLSMYHAIELCANKAMRDYPELKILIPSGTAIQDARTAISKGDDLTRDGYHLELTIGRYIAACTWYAAIFRRIMPFDTWHPKSVSPSDARIAIEAAHIAVMHPWTIIPLDMLIKSQR